MHNYMRKLPILKSLKSRLVVLLIISAIIPIILIGIITFQTTSKLFSSNIDLAINSEMSKMLVGLENTLDSMKFLSQQLVLESSIETELSAYFGNQTEYSKVRILQNLNQKITFYEASNPNIANISYFCEDLEGKKQKLTSSLVQNELPTQNNILSVNNDLVFYGPLETKSVIKGYTAISMMREIHISDTNRVYIYMESGYKKMMRVLTEKLADLKTIYVFSSDSGNVVYSSNEVVVKKDSFMGEVKGKVKIGSERYVAFQEASSYGWKLSLFVPQEEYYKGISSLIISYILITIGAIVMSILIAFLIYKMVYMPLKRFSGKLKQITKENIVDQIESMNVRELDENLEIFHNMKNRIITLIKNTEEEVREKNRLKTKELFHKINPHFLHNTLDTLKWYANTKGYDDIESFISALNKLLLYNMEKDRQTTLNSEVTAVKDYVLLQSIKYDFEFVLKLNVPREVIDAKLPRFVLQPLIENAINHGLEGYGTITLEVYLTSNGNIGIKVCDNGYGMSQDTIKSILDFSKDVSSNGIGMQYVIKMLENEFGDSFHFDIISDEGKGTEIEIIIPYEKGDTDDKGLGY